MDYKTSHMRYFILDSIPVAMVSMDAELKITSFNTRAEQLTGFSAREAIGKPCHTILHSSLCAENCPLQTVQEQGESATGLEAELVNRYHEHIQVRIGSAAIEDDKGNVMVFLEVVEDISREKFMEGEKNNFLFMVAHDMKSPLIAIQGLTRRIREHHDDMSQEQLDEYLKAITGASEQLEEHVRDFLIFSRQATSNIKLQIEDVTISGLINALVKRHQSIATEKQLTITQQYASAGHIQADSHQLQRAFENLLDNAFKFVAIAGEITISSFETEQEVIVEIKDNGPGIAAKDLPFIFDAFYQGVTGNKGHGLGLAAVKAIVREHGGRISVKSSPSQGATFTVRLPKKI